MIAIWLTSLLSRGSKLEGFFLGRENLLSNVSAAGLEKSTIPLFQTSRYSFWASNFSFSLAQWPRDQASHLPTKSLSGHKIHLFSGRDST